MRAVCLSLVCAMLVIVTRENFGVPGVSAQETDDDARERLRSAVTNVVAQERATMSYKVQVTEKGAKEPGKLLVWRDSSKLLIEAGNKRGGLNGEYMFAVERSKQGAAWNLAQFARTDLQKAFDANLGLPKCVSRPLTAVGSKDTIEERLANPAFRVLKQRASASGDVEIDFSTEETIERGNVALNGTITFSAKWPGLVSRYQHSTSSGPRAVKLTLVRHVREVGTKPECSLIEITLNDTKTGNILRQETVTFSDYAPTSARPEEFRLEFYGIPAPAEDHAPPTMNWLVWVFVGVVCVVGAIGIRILVRHRREQGGN